MVHTTKADCFNKIHIRQMKSYILSHYLSSFKLEVMRLRSPTISYDTINLHNILKKAWFWETVKWEHEFLAGLIPERFF